MRLASLAFCLLLLTQAPIHAQAPVPANARCDATKVPGAIKINGRTYREAPDLTPELQRINLMSNVDGCFEYGQFKLMEYQQAHPDDIGVSFITARYIWRMGSVEQATELLKPVVETHPDFASGLVLMGAMNLYIGSMWDARDYLARALKITPDDLWGNINQLKYQAQMDENADAHAQLLGIALAEQAPEAARHTATEFVMKHLKPEDPSYEELLRLQLTFVEGAFREVALYKLAYFMVRTGRQPEARALINDELKRARTLDQKDVSTMLAESYLQEAIKIAPVVTSANESLVKQARAAVDNDFTRLAAFVADYPELQQQLKPFIQTGEVNPNARDAIGYTLLCNAVQNGQLTTMQELIRAGADVNANCRGVSVIGLLTLNPKADIDTQKLMLSYLLANGADPAMAFGREWRGFEEQCKDSTDCREHLWPMVLAHLSKADASQ